MHKFVNIKPKLRWRAQDIVDTWSIGYYLRKFPTGIGSQHWRKTVACGKVEDSRLSKLTGVHKMTQCS